MNRLRPVGRDTDYLLPPAVQDWLPGSHSARYVVDVAAELDLSELLDAHMPIEARARERFASEQAAYRAWMNAAFSRLGPWEARPRAECSSWKISRRGRRSHGHPRWEARPRAECSSWKIRGGGAAPTRTQGGRPALGPNARAGRFAAGAPLPRAPKVGGPPSGRMLELEDSRRGRRSHAPKVGGPTSGQMLELEDSRRGRRSHGYPRWEARPRAECLS